MIWRVGEVVVAFGFCLTFLRFLCLHVDMYRNGKYESGCNIHAKVCPLTARLPSISD